MAFNINCPGSTTLGTTPQVGVSLTGSYAFFTFVNAPQAPSQNYPAAGPVFSTTPGFENISYSYPAGNLGGANIGQIQINYDGVPERAGYATFEITLLGDTCTFDLWISCTDLTTADTLAPPPVT
jgi:hypothetical protein